MEGKTLNLLAVVDPSFVSSEEIDGRVAYEIGNYNALLKDCPAYKKCKFL